MARQSNMRKSLDKLNKHFRLDEVRKSMHSYGVERYQSPVERLNKSRRQDYEDYDEDYGLEDDTAYSPEDYVDAPQGNRSAVRSAERSSQSRTGGYEVVEDPTQDYFLRPASWEKDTSSGTPLYSPGDKRRVAASEKSQKNNPVMEDAMNKGIEARHREAGIGLPDLDQAPVWEPPALRLRKAELDDFLGKLNKSQHDLDIEEARRHFASHGVHPDDVDEEQMEYAVRLIREARKRAGMGGKARNQPDSGRGV